MRTNPFSDALGFLTQASWTTYVFWLLLIASVVIAAVNVRRDSSQRSALHLWNWLARFFIGALWWQQSLWKLPPTYTDQPDGSGGLRYWMGEMAKWASTALQQHFVKDVVLPHFYFFASHVYFSEVLDRKSTRLNSSHEWISYAVFCLKKKIIFEGAFGLACSSAWFLFQDSIGFLG